ncbi:LamG-like jellyroll fold domain-containing protein [Streptomyces sp. NPDC005385]|uniref:LamG-like jellyroll fold domain-containing protein n=1 Tax=Streptomyces sp. NPDC005385 TaxID=3157039 RepID=UPI0033A5DCA5
MEVSEASTSAPTISTTVKRVGTAAMRFNPSATVQYVSHQFGSVVARHVFYRVYLYVATMPNVDTIIMASCDGLGSPGRSPRLFLQTNGSLRTSTGATTTHTYVGGSSATLNTGQWYRVEMDYDSVNDVQHCYLDGTDFSGAVAGAGFTGFEAAVLRVGAFTDVVAGSTTCDLYIDDIAINDDTGSAQNSLPGPGSVVHLRPDSAGDANGWATAVGGTAGVANNFTRVNEVTPNDATSYNQTALTGTTTTDDFNLASSASAGISSADQITLVAVGGRVGSSATTTASIVYRLKSQASGTTVESASVPVNLASFATHVNNTIRPYQLHSYADPQGSGAWTPKLLDTAQIGYRGNVAQTSTRRVSTLWLLVELVQAVQPPPLIVRQAVARASLR